MKEKIIKIYNIPRFNTVGLLAYLYRVVGAVYDVYPQKVYIDWSAPGHFQNPGESKNIWEVLYEQPDINELTDEYEVENRIAHFAGVMSEGGQIIVDAKDKTLGNSVFNPSIVHRKLLKKILDEKFILKEELKNQIDLFFNEKIKGKKCLSVHRRGAIYLHNNSITEDIFNDKLMKIIDENEFDSVFICSDNMISKNNLIDCVKSKQLEVLTYDSHLAYTNKSELPYVKGQGPDIDRNLLAKEILIETYLMSMCSALYRACSSVSTFVMLLNPELPDYHVDENIIYK